MSSPNYWTLAIPLGAAWVWRRHNRKVQATAKEPSYSRQPIVDFSHYVGILPKLQWASPFGDEVVQGRDGDARWQLKEPSGASIHHYRTPPML